MAQIAVNADQWNAASEEDRTMISGLMSKAGLLKSGDTIVADPMKAPLNMDAKAQGFPGNIIPGGEAICRGLCDAATAAAFAGCAGITNGAAAAACYVAATALRDECYGRC